MCKLSETAAEDSFCYKQEISYGRFTMVVKLVTV